MKIKDLITKVKAQCASKQALLTVLAMGAALASQDVLAAGGLDKATQTAEEIQQWLYIITGVACTGNISYLCIMAKMGKKQWNDVLASVGQTAFAGGVVSIATWSYGLFA
jgi:hypothetical protein